VNAPLPRAYWADPGKLLAGPYPGDYDPHDTRRNVEWLLRNGIRRVLSLMEAREESGEDGRSAYVKVIEHSAARLGVACDWQRFEIHDMSVPDFERMDEILAAIDRSIAGGQPVYAHCWGGRGRTGTVVGVYLIRAGRATLDDFVDVIGTMRPPGSGPAPETAEQVEFVRRYVRSRSLVSS
jgi:hypothetical protein